jgi:hypothetical protein
MSIPAARSTGGRPAFERRVAGLAVEYAAWER